MIDVASCVLDEESKSVYLSNSTVARRIVKISSHVEIQLAVFSEYVIAMLRHSVYNVAGLAI